MRIRWNWGWGAALAYAAFALATVGFVIFAIAHPAALVGADYYKQSLAHDRRIEAAANARALGDEVRVTIHTSDRPVAVLALPARHHATASGTVTWYRASDASFDWSESLAIGRDGVQRMTLDNVPPGRWRLKVEWEADGRPFYIERVVTIAP